MAGTMSAQVYTLEGCQFSVEDVTNEGVVVGTRTVNYPFELWYPLTDYSFKTIGGISAGYGIGGNARFSADGKKVSATAMGEFLVADTEWKDVKNFEAYKGYNIVRIYQVPGGSNNMIALLENPETAHTLIISSINGGSTWSGSSEIEAATNGIGFIGGMGVVPCKDGTLQSISRVSVGFQFNGEIQARPEGNNKEVKQLTAAEFYIPYMDFTNKGVIGVEYADGTGGVWVVSNAFNEFSAKKFNTVDAEGVTGVPAAFSRDGEIFYMATKNGKILRSDDLGKTWNEIAGVEGGGVGFSGIKVNPKNPEKIIALGGSHVYFTLDGGKNWTLRNTGYTALSDACWTDENNVYIAAAEGVFKSNDCKNWSKEKDGGFNALAHQNMLSGQEIPGSLFAGGTAGKFEYLSFEKIMGQLATASLYDMETDEWTNFDCFDQVSGDVMSAPWGISGDGNVVVGQAYTYRPEIPKANVHSHATAWINGEPTDLGSKFCSINRFSRASASSYDGSVIVGLQDLCGPWFGAKWVKNADGVYEEKILLKDPAMNEEDIKWTENLVEYQENTKNYVLGRATVVTPDGKWIGGAGSSINYATAAPWILNDEKGLITLGEEEDFATGQESWVTAMNNDASLVFGYGGMYTTWAWTPEDGMIEINDYLASGGIDLEDTNICSVSALSPNGRYIIGFCYYLGEACSYLIDLSQWKKGAGMQLVEQTKATVYPNPVSDQLHVDLPFSGIETSMRIYSMQGSLVKSQQTTSLNNVIDVTGLQPGFYLLNVEAQGAHKTFKIQIKR